MWFGVDGDDPLYHHKILFDGTGDAVDTGRQLEGVV